MNTAAKILVVEDDDSIRRILEMTLRGAGFTRIVSAARGDDGLAAALRERPDAILLDIMMPGMDGLEVCRRVRASAEISDTRIIMLTARTEDYDIVRGLECGADDYVTKPFSRSVLLARIGAVLRRGDPLANGRTLDGLSLDAAGFSAVLGGKAVPLTKTEFLVLSLFAAHPGRVYTRQQIIDATQGGESESTERAVDVQIVGLRRKLGAWAAAHIETVRGVGYRISP